MNRAKALLCMCLACMISVCFAQTEQRGYVKTRGRMVDGVHVPGKGLVGAVVSVKGGNKVGVQETDGSFSFFVRGDSFTIQSVDKKDYVMVDADALPKTYTSSSNDLYLVMETPDQLLLDRLEAESKMLATVRRQLEERKKELEESKRQAKITEEQYRAELLKLYEAQSDEENLVRDMAKRYAEIDYDQLDDFYRQVNFAVEQGDFARADSLLRSLGDIDEQIDAYFKQSESIQREQEKLTKAKEVHQHDKVEMAQRCYSYYETCFLQHKLDSAAHYLKLRAILDTTNVTWQSETGIFIENHLGDFSLAMQYFERSLEINRQKYGDYHEEVAISHNNVGRVYSSQNNYAKAIEHYTCALNIWKQLYGDSHPDVGTAYNNIGTVYAAKEDYSKALEYLMLALSLWRQEYGESHAKVTTVYDNIGMTYMYLEDNDNALKHLNISLGIRLREYGDFHPETAISYEDLGLFYQKSGELDKALEYYRRSLEIRQLFYGDSHPLVARLYQAIATIYQALKDQDKTLEYYNRCLDSRKKALGDTHPEIAKLYNIIGYYYVASMELDKALEYFNSALNIWKQVYGESSLYMISAYVSISLVYLAKEDFAEGLRLFRIAYDLSEQIVGSDNPMTVKIKTQIDNLELQLKKQSDNESDGQ